MILAAFFAGCGGGPRIISEEKLTDIISDMYLADAVSESNMEMYTENDSISLYAPILAKYGYNLKDFNYTMVKYSAESERLQDLYKSVEWMLKARQEKYKPLARIEELSANHWTKADSIKININRLFTKRDFDAELKEPGVYNISTEVYFFADDSTKNPRMAAWLADKNDSVIEKREVELIKDTIYNSYNISLVFSEQNKKFNKLKGYWLNYDTVLIKTLSKRELRKRKREIWDSIDGKQHINFRKLTIKYDFAASDSIKKADSVRIADSLKTKKR